jgi:hypothetical protein
VGTSKSALKFFLDGDAFFREQLPTKPKPIEAGLVKWLPVPPKRSAVDRHR